MVGNKDSNPKDIAGSGKPPVSTLPWPPVYEAGLALLHGGQKYGRHNWRAIGVRSSVYFDAAIGHLTAWWEGEDVDPDSGLNHLAHAIAGLMVLRDANLQNMMNDDRPYASKVLPREHFADTSLRLVASCEKPVAPYIERERHD